MQFNNDHLIVSYPEFDALTKTWKPQIQLTLTRQEPIVPNKAEAERAGLDAAKTVTDSFDSDLGLQ